MKWFSGWADPRPPRVSGVFWQHLREHVAGMPPLERKLELLKLLATNFAGMSWRESGDAPIEQFNEIWEGE